jgi:hypothetical protein
MALSFNPPQDLINAYLNRPNPGLQAIDSIGQAVNAYGQHKLQQQQLASLEGSRKAAEFKAIADYVPEDQIPALARQYGINIPQAGAVPPTPSTGTVPSPTAGPPDAQGAPVTQAPQISPLVQAHAGETGFNPLGIPVRPTSKAGLAKYEKNLQTQKLEKDLSKPDKPEDKYYTTDQATNLLKDNPDASGVIGSFEKDKVPRDAVHLLMTQGRSNKSKDSQTYVGNAEDGSPVNQDKNGNFYVNGQLYNGKILSKTSETPTSSTRTSSENADTLMPHITEMRKLIAEADKRGLIGPVSGRFFSQLEAGKVGTTGNVENDRLLGKLRSIDTLMRSGTMKVHFGSRGGQQMYDHFSGILNSDKQSSAILNGALDGVESFMQGYSNAGHPGIKTGGNLSPSEQAELDVLEKRFGSKK